VDEDRDVGVAVADLLDKGAQSGNRIVGRLGRRELLIVDRQDEGRTAALLLRERGQVAVTGDTQHFDPLVLDGLRQRADAQTRGVLRAEILVDDDDRKMETHPRFSRRGRRCRPTVSSRRIAASLPTKYKG